MGLGDSKERYRGVEPKSPIESLLSPVLRSRHCPECAPGADEVEVVGGGGRPS